MITSLTNDRSWFEGDFVEFDSQISNSRASIANIPVRGIGTVVLPVKQSLAGQGNPHAAASLRLENVLYVPDYPCNVIGRPIRALASIQFSSLTPRGAMVYGDGSIAAIFMPGRDFYQVLLGESHGAVPLGRGVLDEHPEYGFMVGFVWDEAEQERWMSFRASLMRSPSVPNRMLGRSCASEFRFSTGQTMGLNGGGAMQNGFCGMEVDSSSHQHHQQRSRKRGAPQDDDDVEVGGCSPRRAKRSRAMDESEFRPRHSLPAVFSARG